jgi:hypothetical protein
VLAVLAAARAQAAARAVQILSSLPIPQLAVVVAAQALVLDTTMALVEALVVVAASMVLAVLAHQDKATPVVPVALCQCVAAAVVLVELDTTAGQHPAQTGRAA